MPRKKKANGQDTTGQAGPGQAGPGICPSNLSQMQAGRLGLHLLGFPAATAAAGKLKQLKRSLPSWQPGQPDAAFSTINYWPLTDSPPPSANVLLPNRDGTLA